MKELSVVTYFRTLPTARKGLGGITLVALVLGLPYACRTAKNPESINNKILNVSDVDDGDGQAVRLALVQLGKDLPEVKYEDIGTLKTIAPVETVVNQSYSRSLREGLIGSLEYLKILGSGSDKVVRRDLYKIKADQQPFTIAGLGKSIPFPFTLQAGGTIEVGRLYSDAAKAEAAKPFLFTDLPYSLENIKKLEVGTYISLPIKGSLALDLNGNFLAEVYKYSKELEKYINASSVGTYSHVSQGTLLAEGVFSLQLIRLDGDKVRVRVVYGDDVFASGSQQFSLNTNFRFLFIPSSKLQKIRDIKQQIEKGIKQNPLREKLADARGRINQFKSIAQTNVQQLLERIPEELNTPDITNVLDKAKGKVDQAVIQAEKADIKLKDLDQLIFGRADQAYETLDAAYKQRLEPVVDKIKQYSDRNLDVEHSLAMRAELSRKVRNVADYIFDMRDDVAMDALNRAFFARTAWLGATPVSELKVKNTLFYDLSAAEAVATADQDKSSPRVIRLVQASKEFRQTQFGMSFKALFLKAGFSNNLRENSVEVKERSGREESWYSRVWEFNQNFSLAGLDTKEIYTSGYLTPTKSNNLENGAYWFAWQGTFNQRHKTPVQRSLESIHTFLGPVAVKHGVAALYAGEFPGPVNARLQATFHGDLLRAFFDERKVDDALLWKALAQLAINVNAEDVGIPFSENSNKPLGLAQIKGAEEACATVTLYWGGLYCTIFQDDFLQKLHEVRRSGDPVAKLSFFENYYRIGFLFNRLGTKMMVRYFAELAELLGMSEKVQLVVEINNENNPSLEASPRFRSGDSREILMLEAMDVIEGAK